MNSTIRLASIDIGSNTVKLLLADWNGEELFPLQEQGRQTRLGSAVFLGNRGLSDPHVQETIESLREFVVIARSAGAKEILIFATSAVREWSESEGFQEKVQRATGLRLKILSPEEEAQWAYYGVSSLRRFRETAKWVIDIGGGTVECSYGQGERLLQWQSLPFGAVRLLQQRQGKEVTDPGEFDRIVESLTRSFRGVLPEEPYLGVSFDLVATGGTAVVLGAIHWLGSHPAKGAGKELGKRLDAYLIRRGEIQRVLHWIVGLPCGERRRVAGLPPERADVFPFGVAVLLALMEVWKKETLWITRRGIRFGALRVLAQQIGKQ